MLVIIGCRLGAYSGVKYPSGSSFSLSFDGAQGEARGPSLVFSSVEQAEVTLAQCSYALYIVLIGIY